MNGDELELIANDSNKERTILHKQKYYQVRIEGDRFRIRMLNSRVWYSVTLDQEWMDGVIDSSYRKLRMNIKKIIEDSLFEKSHGQLSYDFKWYSGSFDDYFAMLSFDDQQKLLEKLNSENKLENNPDDASKILVLEIKYFIGYAQIPFPFILLSREVGDQPKPHEVDILKMEVATLKHRVDALTTQLSLFEDQQKMMKVIQNQLAGIIRNQNHLFEKTRAIEEKFKDGSGSVDT